MLLDTKPQKIKHRQAPSAMDCLKLLGLTRLDYALLREMKELGVINFCKTKLEEVGAPVKSGKYSKHSSNIYKHFRKMFKDKDSKWKNLTTKDITEDMKPILNLIENKDLPKETREDLLLRLGSLTYILSKRIDKNK